MKRTIISLLGTLTFAGLLISSFSVSAQRTAGTPDRLDSLKKAQDDLERAAKERRDHNLSTRAIQTELEKLAEKKKDAERDLRYTRTKLDAASADLASVTRTGPQEAIEKAQREVAAWEARVKSSQEAMDQLDEQTQNIAQEFQKSLMEGPKSPFILPGESLQLIVLEDDSLNGLYQVREGGYILLPRVGRISVAGKELPAVEKAVKEALEATQLKQATVTIERVGSGELGSNVIYLAGEFTQGGPMRIPQGVAPTIVTTILRAGGVKPNADLTRVKLLRMAEGKSLVEEVNVRAMLDGNGLQADLALNPGDVLVVPAAAPIVYVTGKVVKPGIVRMYPDEEDLTAYSAILRSGGFARFANLKKVHVLRDRGNGDKQRIPVSIKGVKAGQSQDVILQDLDIIVVPEKFFSW